MADNPSLEKDVSARINEREGTIYALLPKGAGKANLAPYFSAQGTVTVGSAEQTSGRSRLDFSNEVIYTVTSANGLYSKQYAVSVQEAGPVIYVNAAAIGRNNGTCWQDAYITLDAAFEQAAAYGDAHKEIWIAHNGGEAYEPLSDEYRQNGLPLTANTIIRGGFEGKDTETDADKRLTKERKIEFDVNAVKDAISGTRSKIEILHNADVCAVKTKLCMPADGTGNFFFRSAFSGKIEFDGIEIEQKLKNVSLSSEKILFFSEETNDLDVIFSDCTVRCASITEWNTRYTRDHNSYSIENSDFYACVLTGKSVDAFGSYFNPNQDSSEYDISLVLLSSLSLKVCVLQAEPKQPCPVYLANNAQINSCFFDNAPIQTSSDYVLYLTNCLYSCENSYTHLNACGITNCEMKIKSGYDYIRGEYYRNDNATIENSYIEGFVISSNNISLSVTNSMFKKSSFNMVDSNNRTEIELTNTTMEETGNSLIGNFDDRYSPNITFRLTNCTFSDSQDSSTSYNDDYITLNSENSHIDIDRCTFNIHGKGWLYTNGSATIKDSHFLCESEINNRIKTGAGTTEITHNTFKSKGAIELSLPNPSKWQSDTKTVFTENTLEGKYTKLTAFNIQKLEKNWYNNFVEYDLYSPLTKDSIDFLTETIDAPKSTKKAFLSLSNGDISIEDERYKDFLCGLHLYNASAIVTGQDFGNMPSFLGSYLDYYVTEKSMNRIARLPVSGSGYMLALTDCTVEGTKNAAAMDIDFTDATLTNCTVKGKDSLWGAIRLKKGNLTVEKSEIKGDIKDGYAFEANIKLKDSKLIGVYENIGADYGNIQANNITVSKSSVGHIYSENGTITVSDGSTVNDHITTDGTVTLEDCEFDGRNRNDFDNMCITATELTIDNCSFSNYTNNYAGYFSSQGGALCIDANKVDIINGTKFISNNTKYWRGGAVYIEAKNITLSDCMFIDNQTLESVADNSGGGAIAIQCTQDDVVAFISNCIFTDNSSAVANRGIDVCMIGHDQYGEYKNCKLIISDCSTNKSDTLCYTNNITVSGNITKR
ncbi:MAG: hypothetical protein K2O09_08245 [Treponemataceae bacterium]|nr:hypothetical protein [Treponemataceae bacterium]